MGILGDLAGGVQSIVQGVEQGVQSLENGAGSAFSQAANDFGFGNHGDGGHTQSQPDTQPQTTSGGNGNGHGGGGNGNGGGDNGNGRGGGNSGNGAGNSPTGPSFLEPNSPSSSSGNTSPAPAPAPAPAPTTPASSDPKTTNNGSSPNPGSQSSGLSGNTSSGSNNGGQTTNGGNGSSNQSSPPSGQSNNTPSGSGGNTQGSGSQSGNTGTQQSSSSSSSSSSAQNQPQSQPQQSQSQNANPNPAPAQQAPAQQAPAQQAPAQSQPQSQSVGTQAAAAGAQQQASQPASQSASQQQASAPQQASPKEESPSNISSPDAPATGPQTSAVPVIAQTTTDPKHSSTLVLQSSTPSPTNPFLTSSAATAAASSTVVLDPSQSVPTASTLITSVSSPSFTSQAQSAPTSAISPTNSNASTGLTPAAKAGIAVGVILGLVALAALAFGIVTYRRRREAEAAMDEKDPFSDRAALAAEPLRATSPGGYAAVSTQGPNELSATPLVAGSPINEKSGPRDWSVPMDGTAPNVESTITNPSATPLLRKDAALAGAGLVGAGAGAALAATSNNSNSNSAAPSSSNPADNPARQSQDITALPLLAGAATTGAIAGTAMTNNAAVHRVQLDFQPSMEDELELRAGQLVRLLHEYDDGWALCVRLDRSAQGVVPRSCLSLRPVQRNNGPGPIPNQNASRIQQPPSQFNQIRPAMANNPPPPPPQNTNTIPPRPLQAVSPISPATNVPGAFPDLSKRPSQKTTGRMSTFTTISRIDTSVPRDEEERNSPVSPVSRGPSVLNRKPVGGNAPPPVPTERRVSQ